MQIPRQSIYCHVNLVQVALEIVVMCIQLTCVYSIIVE